MATDTVALLFYGWLIGVATVVGLIIYIIRTDDANYEASTYINLRTELELFKSRVEELEGVKEAHFGSIEEEEEMVFGSHSWFCMNGNCDISFFRSDVGPDGFSITGCPECGRQAVMTNGGGETWT